MGLIEVSGPNYSLISARTDLQLQLKPRISRFCYGFCPELLVWPIAAIIHVFRVKHGL